MSPYYILEKTPAVLNKFFDLPVQHVFKGGAYLK